MSLNIFRSMQRWTDVVCNHRLPRGTSTEARSTKRHGHTLSQTERRGDIPICSAAWHPPLPFSIYHSVWWLVIPTCTVERHDIHHFLLFPATHFPIYHSVRGHIIPISTSARYTKLYGGNKSKLRNGTKYHAARRQVIPVRPAAGHTKL
jgi:hypothetical protein